MTKFIRGSIFMASDKILCINNVLIKLKMMQHAISTSSSYTGHNMAFHLIFYHEALFLRELAISISLVGCIF